MIKYTYDKTLKKIVDGVRISYGILCGNEKIVFIKTGSDGNIKGYKDKYLKIAYKLKEKIGATVICASNPCELDHDQQMPKDKAIISEVANELNLSSYELHFFGTSDGVFYNLDLASQLPQTVKLLCINTSTTEKSGFEGLKERILKLNNTDMIFVYGDKDYEYNNVSKLEKLNLDNLRLVTVEGADHDFNDKLEEYISLADLL